MFLPRSWIELTESMVQGHVVTDDGVDLLYQTFGQGPAVVFANGIGVRFPGAVKQIETLRFRHRVICWDYRGMGQSVIPDGIVDLSMQRQARDALVVLEALGEPRAVFVGWSMGVQVSLEVVRLSPQRVAGLVALFGSFGAPFRTGLPAPLGRLVEEGFTRLQRFPGLAQAALDLAMALPGLAFKLFSRAAFVGTDADPEVFAANVRSVAGVEKSLYLRTMLALAAHDASDLLPLVGCPTLVVCGARDYVTPPKVARRLAESIPGATYRELADATHFGLIEQPALVNGWILELLERAYADGAVSTARACASPLAGGEAAGAAAAAAGGSGVGATPGGAGRNAGNTATAAPGDDPASSRVEPGPGTLQAWSGATKPPAGGG